MPKSPRHKRHNVSRHHHRPPRTSIGPGIHEYFGTNPCFEENHRAYMDALSWINDLNIKFQEISQKKQEGEAILFERIKKCKAEISQNNETISNLERKLSESRKTISVLKKRARTSSTTGGTRKFGESDLEGVSYIFPEEDDIHLYESFHEDNVPSMDFLNNRMSSEDFQVNENNLRSHENRMIRNARISLHDRKLGREFVAVKRLHMPHQQSELIDRPNSSEEASQSVNVISETVSESSYEPSSPSMTFGSKRQKPNELLDLSFNVDTLQENNLQDDNHNIFELSIQEVSYASELSNKTPELNFPLTRFPCLPSIDSSASGPNLPSGDADDFIEIQESNVNDVPQPQSSATAVENEGDGDHVTIPDDDQYQVNILEYSLMQSSMILISSFSFRDGRSSDVEWKPYDLQNDESAFKIITVDVQYGRKPPIKKCYVAQLQEEMTYANGTNLEKIYHVVYYRRKEQKMKGIVKTVFVKPLLRKFFVCEFSDVIFGLPTPTEARRGGLLFDFDFEPFNIPKF